MVAPNGYERLSAQDSAFVMLDGGRGQLAISRVAVFDAAANDSLPFDIARYRSYVESRLHRIPHYRSVVQKTPLQRHPIWVDDDRFDIAHHVRHTALPRPGGTSQLKELAGSITSRPLDVTRPLWELWFVEGLAEGGFAVIAKVHHCMVDGVAGVGVVTALLSPVAEFEDPPAKPRKPWKPRPAPGLLDFVRDSLSETTGLAVDAARNLGGALQHPGEIADELVEAVGSGFNTIVTGLSPPPVTPINRPIGTQRRVEWNDVDLVAVKDVKKRLDGSVNDVILAVVAGAMRRFFERRKLSVKGLDLRVIIPVDTRSGAVDMSVGNKVSSWFLDLPVSECDPRTRFEKIREQTRKRKQQNAEKGVDLFLRFADWSGSSRLPYWGVSLIHAVRPYNMIVTNVQGPPVPLYLLGSRLRSLVPTVPLFEGQALSVAVMSYIDRISFGLSADWDSLPDLGDLSQLVGASFDELREAAEGSERPRKRRRKRASTAPVEARVNGASAVV